MQDLQKKRNKGRPILCWINDISEDITSLGLTDRSTGHNK